MSTKQILIIAGAIILAGVLIAFGPGVLSTQKQAQIDESFECAAYRAQVSLDNLVALNGKRPDRETTERMRRAAGCTPVR